MVLNNYMNSKGDADSIYSYNDKVEVGVPDCLVDESVLEENFKEVKLEEVEINHEEKFQKMMEDIKTNKKLTSA